MPVDLWPELSALGIRKPVAPGFDRVLAAMREFQRAGQLRRNPVVVDQGCGQLRVARHLISWAGELILVDTPRQLTRLHDFFGKELTIAELVQKRWPKRQVRITDTERFSRSRLEADCIFS